MGITTRIFKKVANAGSAVANSRFGQAVADKANAANNKLTKAAEKVLTSPSRIIKYDEDGIPKGLNGLGYSVIGLSTAASVVTSAYNENERKHIGTIDSRIVSPTPDYSVYRKGATMSAPGGADGSLVFALDKTKNGGFL